MRYVLGVEAMQSARAQRPHRSVRHRARALGRHRDGAARHPLGADDGQQRREHAGGGQHGGVQPAPGGRPRGGATRCSCSTATIEAEIGVSNVITTVAEPSIESAEQIFRHPDVALLCVTGGPAVVKAAAQSGKRVIAGGPGNPPVVVDEDADLDLAARSIIEGAAFDNNLLCIGEKEVFVVERVADDFIEAMSRAGAVQLERAGDQEADRGRVHLRRPGQGLRPRAREARPARPGRQRCWRRRPA